MNDAQRDATLQAIEKSIGEIKEALRRDFAAIYGNGHAGLLQRMTAMETWQKGHSDAYKWIISTVIAVAAVAVAYFKR